MTFKYKLENGHTQIWTGTCGNAHVGTFLEEIPVSFSDTFTEYRELVQVHGNQVIDDLHYHHSQQEGDGLISKRPSTLLTIRTADCIPVFLTGQNQVGMIHAGWRSIKAGILEKALAFFNLHSCHAVMGPSIFAENYEVDQDLYGPWSDPDLSGYLSPSSGTKRLLDLRGLTEQILRRTGVDPQNIYQIPLCSFRDNLPSYRRNGQGAGRMIHFIYFG